MSPERSLISFIYNAGGRVQLNDCHPHFARAFHLCSSWGDKSAGIQLYTFRQTLLVVSPGMIKQTPPPRADNDNNNSDNDNVATKTIISGNCDKPAEIHLVILFLGHFLERSAPLTYPLSAKDTPCFAKHKNDG